MQKEGKGGGRDTRTRNLESGIIVNFLAILPISIEHPAANGDDGIGGFGLPANVTQIRI